MKIKSILPMLITALALIAAHGLLVAWLGIKLSDKIAGWFLWIMGGGLIAFGLYHVSRCILVKGRRHDHLFRGHAHSPHEVQFMRGAFGGDFVVDDVTKAADRNQTPSPTGFVLHAAAAYDLLIWLVMLGREGAFREKLLGLARLKTGEAVLDVGCGTGTLAIAAKRHVGPTGTVYGIDASPEMIAKADKKARKAGVEIAFKNGFAQSLPFPDAQFDVVLTTLMLHHLHRKAREELAVEMRRVLKPGGRVLAVDFGGTEQEKKGFLDHFHHRHGHVSPVDIIDVLSKAGLEIVENGAVGIKDLQFVFASAPGCT